MADSPIIFTLAEVSTYYAAQVPHLKRCGAEWRGPCPVHGGRDDNFAVNPETGAAFCHSRCGRGWDLIGLEQALTGTDFKTAKAEIFRLVGRIEPNYQRPHARANGNSAGAAPTKPTKPTSAANKWREIERYPYVDRDGTLLFEVVRYIKPDGTKTFIPVRPSGVEAAGTEALQTGGIVVGLAADNYVPDPAAARKNGKPAWKRATAKDSNPLDGACLRECPRVPYRLPQILGAGTIYLPEGEKDAHTLEAWGLVASCNPGGSGSSDLYAEWGDYFRRRNLVILPDNDGPGRRHALTVATTLMSVAASIRIVELHGLPPKGDVSDWRDAGGTLDQFKELIEAAAPLDAEALSELRARWRITDNESNSDQRSDTETRDEWPDPVPFQSELPPVEPFNDELLPRSFRPLVRDIAERMQVPMDFPAIALVLCLAGAVNRRANIQPKANDSGWNVTPNLWGGIIAPPGFMKSPVIQAVARPLNRIQSEWQKEYADALVEHERSIEECDLRKSAWRDQFKQSAKNGSVPPERPSEPPKQPTLRRLIVNDPTFEKLHEIMSENPAGVLLIRDELTGWWSQLDRAGREGERAFHLQAWNGDTGHISDRIGRGTIYVPACCESMLGGIQPGRLRSYLRDALVDGPGNDGLIQRFQLLVWPDTPPDWVYVDRKPDAASEELATAMFRELVELDPEKPLLFRFDADAQKLFVEWLGELESKVRRGELHPALASHLSKYRGLMPSLALLFELADLTGSGGFDGSVQACSQNFVNLEHTRQAAALCDYLESHARRIYSCIVTPQLRAACELADKIKKKKVGADGFFCCRDVYTNDWTGLDTREAVKAAAEVLEDANWVRAVIGDSGPQGGRPSARYQVNPKVWK